MGGAARIIAPVTRVTSYGTETCSRMKAWLGLGLGLGLGQGLGLVLGLGLGRRRHRGARARIGALGEAQPAVRLLPRRSAHARAAEQQHA